jgi:hypothetical protein
MAAGGTGSLPTGQAARKPECPTPGRQPLSITTQSRSTAR